MKGENMSVNNLPETAGTAPEPIPQLALEIRNLAHRAWEDRPNAEFLFREIGKRAQKISERVSALAAPSQEATPTPWLPIVQQIHSHKPIVACEKCNATSLRQA